MEWIRQLDGTAEWVRFQKRIPELVTRLVASGFEPASYPLNFELSLTGVKFSRSRAGWELRHVRNEAEAKNRSEASDRAFKSTLDPPAQLNRYLRFMRSPVYDRERDLVAVAPDGGIGAFMVWWSDPSGIAQIEPFATHPDFQRQGVGGALLPFGLERMRAAGMRTVRVCTDESRERAVAFYSSLGFRQGPRLGSWRALSARSASSAKARSGVPRTERRSTRW